MVELLESLVNQLNLKLDLEKYLDKTQLDKNLKRENETYLAECPFHKEDKTFPLSINSKKRTYKCQKSGCPLETGGDLINLYSKIKNVPLDESAIGIFEEIGIENADDNQPLVRNLYLNIAEKREFEGMLESAKYTLLKAYQSFPQNLIILSRLANIYVKEKNIEKACKYLLKAVEIVQKMRNYSGAHSTLRRIFSLDPRNEEALQIQRVLIYQEWQDFLEGKFTKEELDNFEKRISMEDVPVDLRAKITELLTEHKRLDLIPEITRDFNQEMSSGNKNRMLEYLEHLEKAINEKKAGLEGLFFYLGQQFLNMEDDKKAINYLNLAKEAALAGKTSVPISEIQDKIDLLEEKLFKNDFQTAKDLQEADNFEEAAKVYKKIIEMGVKRHEIFENFIICEYKLGREEVAANTCIQMSEYFFRRDNHIGAIITLQRALNFIPDYPPVVEKLCELYNTLGYQEMAEELKSENEKRRHKKSVISKPLEEEIEIKPKTLAKQKMHPIEHPTHHQKIPASLKESSEDLKSEVPSPPSPILDSRDEVPLELPASFRLTGTSISTDFANLIDGKSVSLGINSCKINLGSKEVFKLPLASINYTLTNAQIVLFFEIPNRIDPLRLFGKIDKIQNVRNKDETERIISVELLQEDYSERKEYIQFLEKFKSGQIKIGEEKSKIKDFKKTKLSKPSSTKLPEKKDKKFVKSYKFDYNIARDRIEPEKGKPVQKQKKVREIKASVRFVGYRPASSKAPEPLPVPARLIDIEKSMLTIDYGALHIPGVRPASLNFFLKNHIQLIIEFEDSDSKKNLQFFGETKTARNKRQGRDLIFFAEVEIKDSDSPTIKTLLKTMVS